MYLFKVEVEGKWIESAGAGHASIVLVIKKRLKTVYEGSLGLHMFKY